MTPCRSAPPGGLRYRVLLPVATAALVSFAALLYDLAFLAYAAVPLVLYLMLAPQRLYRSRVHRGFMYVLSAALLFGLLFVLTAEWVFWGEFGARFNFIAVDYLVYSDEVLGNIHESYPIGWLLGGLGALALYQGAARVYRGHLGLWPVAASPRP